MRYFEALENALLFHYNGETVLVKPWGENSLRVQSTLMSDISDDSAALLAPKETACEIEIPDEFNAYIKNGKITAHLNMLGWPRMLQTEFLNNKGETLLKEISPGGALMKCARKFSALPGGNFHLKASFESNPTEKIYGMGQYQQDILNLKGLNLELRQRNSQISIPFYLSSLGYGFLWNNAAVGEVHFGLNTTEWISESTKKLDYWITAGDTPAEIEEQYASCVGCAPMMPEYGLGLWQCKLRYYNQEQVLSVAREYKRRNIPLDVIIIDYYHWLRNGDWSFDNEFFPDPKGMADELHKMGVKLMVSIWPNVDFRSGTFEDMLEKGLLVRSNYGVDVQMLFFGNNNFTDFSNPRARAYIWDKCKKNYADNGVDAFWLDVAEPEYGNYDLNMYRYYAGSAVECGNMYPREYSRAFYEGQMAKGQTDIVNLVRCAWAGSQRYGALVWSGDIHSTYEDFKRQITAGLNISLAGIPWWNTDIGGFHGGDVNDPDFVELLLRWFEFGCFCPVMRMHGSRSPFTEVVNRAGEVREHEGAPNEIWSYGEKAYEIMKKYVFVREMLKPYLRNVMRLAHEKGSPVMRAMFYEFPKDEKAYECRHQYMFGPDLLVAPICEKHAVSRKVYLPEGASWTHAGTGKVYEGGQEIEIHAEIDSIPVFLRDGRQEYLIQKI
ncbi:MAG: glycoside hydrolase family 31 protein [Clostridia bacterium]|nr:glycoside hydrolase family 31 protein [Clostridia bacterium]